jgi:hypothetical protein
MGTLVLPNLLTNFGGGASTDRLAFFDVFVTKGGLIYCVPKFSIAP